MSVRPPTPPLAAVNRARSRMAPGGRRWSESPIPRPAVRKVKQIGGPDIVTIPPDTNDYMSAEYGNIYPNPYAWSATIQPHGMYACVMSWRDILGWETGGPGTVTAPAGWRTVYSSQWAGPFYPHNPIVGLLVCVIDDATGTEDQICTVTDGTGFQSIGVNRVSWGITPPDPSESRGMSWSATVGNTSDGGFEVIPAVDPGAGDLPTWHWWNTACTWLPGKCQAVCVAGGAHTNDAGYPSAPASGLGVYYSPSGTSAGDGSGTGSGTFGVEGFTSTNSNPATVDTVPWAHTVSVALNIG